MGGAIDRLLNQTKQQQQKSQEGELERRIADYVNKATKEVDDAEAALVAAYDDGEGAEIARAQRVVAQKAARLERVTAEADSARAQLKNSERREGGARTESELDTTNLNSWKSKHSSWYGVDAEMTKAAHEIDAKIRAAGVITAGTKEYFDAVDRQMSQRYPDRLGGTPPVGGGSGGDAPAPRGQTRIAASIADGYRRMGIDIDNPEVAKRMLANRQKAVNKGWLPEQPVNGRILTR